MASPLCAAVSAEAAAVAAVAVASALLGAPPPPTLAADRDRVDAVELAVAEREILRAIGEARGGARGGGGGGEAGDEGREGGRGGRDAGGDDGEVRRRFPESRREEAAAIVRRARARRGERTRGDGRMRTSGDDDAAE